MKKFMLFLGTILLVNIWILSANIQPAGAQQWNLKFHHHTTGITHENAFVPYAKAIEDATKGKVKVTIYPAQALGKMNEAYTLATSGIADIAWGLSAAFPRQFPLTELISLPLLGIHNGVVSSRVMWGLYQKFPEAFNKEYGEVKVLTLHSGSPSLLGTGKKAVRSIGDLKGLRVRTPPGPPSEMMKKLGASPIMMSPPDTYLAMEKGTIDGYLFDWIAVETFKYGEVSKYFTDLMYHLPAFWIVMNKKVWESMPEDVQKQIMGVSGEKAAVHFGSVWDGISEQSKKKILSEPGKETITFTPEVMSQLTNEAKPIHDDYVSKLQSKGIPAAEIFQELSRMAEQFGK